MQRILTRKLNKPCPPTDVAIQLARPLQLPKLSIPPQHTLCLEGMLEDRAVRTTALGRLRLNVAVYLNNMRQAVIPVELDVQRYEQLAVAGRRIEKDEVLTTALLHAERRLIRGDEGYLTWQEAVSGKKALRILSPGQVLRQTDVEPAEGNPVLVKQRDVVKLTARIGTVVVTATGEALQEGRVGQWIRVRNLSSNTVVQGRVVDRAFVEVEY